MLTKCSKHAGCYSTDHQCDGCKAIFALPPPSSPIKKTSREVVTRELPRSEAISCHVHASVYMTAIIFAEAF